MTYPLYHTLNKKSKKRSLNQEQKDKIKKFIAKQNKNDEEGTSTHFKEAIIMLIAEHARLYEDFDVENFSKNTELPYGLLEKSGNVNFNLEKLPKELQQILWKFIEPKL